MALEIVDPSENHSDLEPSSIVEEIQAILPYFPQDERMAMYLTYVSSGWTRRQSRIRAGAEQSDLDFWRKDDRFRELDDLDYGELRKNVADNYAERLIRKNAIQFMEFDSELLITAQQKIAAGDELTKDERAFLLKRAGIYGPETLNITNKLLNKGNQEEEGNSEVIDIVAFIRARRQIG